MPAQEALVMAATQRPIALNALHEAGNEPRWRTTPSWFVYGDGDKNIPAKALQFMADRAGSKQTVVVPGASHVVMVSHPQEVAELIVTAAADALKDHDLQQARCADPRPFSTHLSNPTENSHEPD